MPMKMTNTLRVALGCMAALASACAPDDEASSIALGAWNARYAEVACDNLVACTHLHDDLVGLAMQAEAAPDACPAWLEQVLARSPTSEVSLVAEGRLRYVPDAAGACLAALRSACAVDVRDVPECRAAFVGEIAAGEACAASSECAAGLACSSSDCPVCEAEAPIVRTTGVGAGGACGYVDATATAPATFRACADALYCNADHVCAARTASGEPCTTSDACAAGTLCLGELGLGDVCGVVPIRDAVGAACSSEPGPDFALCNRMLGLACHDGACRQGGDGLAGSTCYPATDTMPCTRGLRCDEATLTCVDLAADGAACTSDADCASGHCRFDAAGATCGADVCGE